MYQKAKLGNFNYQYSREKGMEGVKVEKVNFTLKRQ